MSGDRMDDEARDVIDTLGLLPHPEGGFFRETFRSPLTIAVPQGSRAASTAIYFLLPAGNFSAIHRVRSDEVWHHYGGGPVDLHTIAPDGRYQLARLGRDLARGERPQHIVPAGVWQGAAASVTRYALCGCTVAPGFDFADFEMPLRGDLVAQFPQLREFIEPLTRG